MKVVIIGAGPTGLSAGYFCKKHNIDFAIYDQDNEIGGLCKTKQIDGFHFDYGMHFLWSSTQEYKDLIAELFPKDNITYQKRGAYILYKDTLVPYPFQANLHYLPEQLAYKCVCDFIDNYINIHEADVKSAPNFLEWIKRCYGEGISNTFMIPFNKKFWRVSLDKLTTEGCSRIPRPTLQDLLKGFILRQDLAFGNNATIGYPSRGGIQGLYQSLSSRVGNIHLNKKVRYISVLDKVVHFENGDEVKYDVLLSTIPLPNFESMIEDPTPVCHGGCGSWNKLSSLKSLRSNTVYAIMLGIKAHNILGQVYDHWEPIHWVYYHEPQYMFYRINVPSNVSTGVAPPGCTSLLVEASAVHSPCSKQLFTKESVLDASIENLQKTGIIRPEHEIVVKNIEVLYPAYVMFDKDYYNKYEVIDYLKSHSIYPMGRYGEWKYQNMLDGILDAKQIVDKIIGGTNE